MLCSHAGGEKKKICKLFSALKYYQKKKNTLIFCSTYKTNYFSFLLSKAEKNEGCLSIYCEAEGTAAFGSLRLIFPLVRNRITAGVSKILSFPCYLYMKVGIF